jgi:hypothetical protein
MIGVILPILLLSVKSIKESENGLLTTSILVLFGVVFNRFNMTFFTQSTRVGGVYFSSDLGNSRDPWAAFGHHHALSTGGDAPSGISRRAAEPIVLSTLSGENTVRNNKNPVFDNKRRVFFS